MSKSTTTTAKCKECDHSGELVDDTGLCHDCHSDRYVWCQICQSDVYRDQPCRHVSWSDGGYYVGCGSTDVDWSDQKADFLLALDALAKLPATCCDRRDHPNLITGLEIEIGRNRFWNREAGFMFSCPDLEFYRERPDLKHRNEDGSTYSLTWATIRPCDWESAGIDLDDENMGDGFRWLASLQAGKTNKANEETVKWIQEWKARKKHKKRKARA